MHKTMQELVEEYIQKNGYFSERGPMFNGGLDGLIKYIQKNGYYNPSTREIYECLKQYKKNNSKNHSTIG